MIDTNEALNEVQNDSEVLTESVQETQVPEESPSETTSQEGLQKEDSSETTNAEYTQHVQNWRALREKAERAERERDEALARLNAGNNKEQQQQFYELGDDDWAEGKHLKQFQSQSEMRMRQIEEQIIETKLRSAYPDFDNVVTAETLGMLKDTDPELAESLAANPNMYSKAVAAYKSIKRYGLSPKSYEKEKEMAKKNSNKPRTVTSISPQQGNSPLARANAFAERLTPERKKQIREEMREIIKNS